MEEHDKIETPFPVICVDSSAVPAFQIFNPNEWENNSRAVIWSCSTEFSVLQHGATRIAELCQQPRDCCRPHFENLKSQWERSKWDLTKTRCYGQVPDLHLLIEAFFSSLKTLLDLIVQLLSTEKIVGVNLNGFHRTGSIYGGAVLNALENNGCAGKKPTATFFKELITEHKQLWIDEVIQSRDLLVHPTQGAQQLMFEIQLENQSGTLVFKDAVSPYAGGQTISDYSAARIVNMKQFAQAFLAGFR